MHHAFHQIGHGKIGQREVKERNDTAAVRKRGAAGQNIFQIGADRVCRQVFLSLYRHGARKFVFLNGHGGNIKMIERLGMEFEDKGCLVAMLNWWLMAWDMNPAWKGGHGGGEETAAILGIDPSLVDKNEIGGELQFKHLSDNLKTTGFRSVEFKGVNVDIIRNTPHVTDSGWIGPDHPSTATEEWGKEMLETTANYIVDFMEEFKKVKLS